MILIYLYQKVNIYTKINFLYLTRDYFENSYSNESKNWTEGGHYVFPEKIWIKKKNSFIIEKFTKRLCHLLGVPSIQYYSTMQWCTNGSTNKKLNIKYCKVTSIVQLQQSKVSDVQCFLCIKNKLIDITCKK